MSSYTLIIILAVNCICTLAFLVWGLVIVPNTKIRQHIPGGRKRYLLLSAMFLLCPAAGFACYITALAAGRIFFRKDADLSGVVFSKDRAETFARADEERELNITSFEEAVAVSDYRSLRTLMLNVLRGDVSQSLAAISLALNSADSETSHYAATALRDELGRFRDTVRRIYIEIGKRDENSAKYCCMAIDYMNTVLEQKVLAGMEQKTYTDMLDEIGAVLYAADKSQFTPEYYGMISMRLTEMKEYDRAERWCVVGNSEYPDSLIPYKCMLKLYYEARDREKFFETMEGLRRSQITIDKETLELIRVFN